MDFIFSRTTALAAAGAYILIYLTYNLLMRLLTYRRQYLISTKAGCKPIPAFPHKDPILGLDMFLRNYKLSQTGGFLDDLKHRHEKVIGGGRYTFTQLLLGDRMILTAEPENIKAVLATQFKDFELPQRRKDAMVGIFGHGIFTTDGAEWEASRALLRPNFNRSQVGDINMFEKHVSNLIARIPRNGETVDVQQLFFKLTMDSATEFLFGQSTDVLRKGGNADGERFEEAFGYVTFKAGLESRVGKLASLLPDKRYREDVKFVQSYVGRYVEKAMRLRKEGKDGDGGKYVLLNELAKTDYTAKKIQDELLNILLAGRDTTASMLAYFFWYLARRPDVQGKLRKEIDGLVEGRKPSFEEIKGMKYLQWCLNETLRLHPIVPANGRVAIRDTTLPTGGGLDGKSPIFVAKGQPVNYQVYVMHRRKDIYGEDADEFRPERWAELRPSWTYLPFNGGPRICIGQQFALTEASYTIIRILQSFGRIEGRGEGDLTEYLTLTSAVRAGVHVGMTPP